VFGRLAGYEDVNDADRLGRDPAMRWIVGGRAVTEPGRRSRTVRVTSGQHAQRHLWRDVLDSVVARYRSQALRPLLRGDAGR